MKRKILIYGDVDVNIIDGSSIWLINLARLLSQDKDNVVDVLLKKRIRQGILTKSLDKLPNVHLLYVKNYIDRCYEVECGNIHHVLETLDELREYSCMILRGFPIMKKVANSKVANKVIPYLTDFCHDKTQLTQEDRMFLKRLYEQSRVYFVQTQAMKDYLKDVLKVDGEKYKVLYPVVCPYPAAKKKFPKSIVYAGKLAKDWNILELMDIMDQLYLYDPSITLHMVGDKFNRDLADQKQEILTRLKSMPNVKFYGSLPRDEVNEIVSACQIGYSFRSHKVDNDHSLELSVKLLEYCYAGVPMLLRRSKMHEAILGKDYPFFVESTQDCVNCLLDIFLHQEKLKTLQQHMQASFQSFTPDNIYQQIQPGLDLFPKKKLRLLVCGHDLKFLKPLFPYMKQDFELSVYELKDYMDFHKKTAKQFLKKADIIWCEWLLANAQWFSQHVYPHQQLYIRAHRFECMRRFGYHLEIPNVTRLICVSYYWYEMFTAQFHIPKEKAIIINNFVDTKGLSAPKKEDAKYHLALIGALPKRKGLQRAIELLRILKQEDERYCLHVPGKRPEEFANTWNVEEERSYYLEAYQMIKDYGLKDSVFFDGWVDMKEFMKGIGYVLSLSDRNMPESFHMTPLEGIASGSMAFALRWEGIEYIYPEELIFESLQDIAQHIVHYTKDQKAYDACVKRNQQFVKENYDIEVIWDCMHQLLTGGGVR